MSQLRVEWEDPAIMVLALLLCGHVLADFLFQTNWMVREKKRSLYALLIHALEVGIVQGVMVLVFSWSIRGLALVGGIALAHFAIDWAKTSLDRRAPRRALVWLLGDQAAHVGILILAWRLWPAVETAGPISWIGWSATLLAVVVFNGNGGSAIVGAILSGLDDLKLEDEGPKGAGRMIGILERLMILGLVCANQWGAVGLVLTAKSVARFKKMDDKAFAEIYLVGTMTSVIVAMLSGSFLRLVL